MTASAISFIAWAIFMLVLLGATVWTARRNRHTQTKMEDTAATCLPNIGGIAEKKHQARFGRAPTDAPGGSDESRTSWYPEVKKKVAKHA